MFEVLVFEVPMLVMPGVGSSHDEMFASPSLLEMFAPCSKCLPRPPCSGAGKAGEWGRSRSRWMNLSLSMSNHESEPILFTVTVNDEEGEGGKGREGGEGGKGEGQARVWRSWEGLDASGGDGWTSVGSEGKRTGGQAEEAEKQGQVSCWYKLAKDRAFIQGCAPLTADEEQNPNKLLQVLQPLQPLQPGGCPLASATLDKAVRECSRRHGCGGVTFSPQRGVFELRSGPHVGDSTEAGEVSWVKAADLCWNHIAVIPPERCMTYSSPPNAARTCNRRGAFLPFNFASGCSTRTFLIDETGRPVKMESPSKHGGGGQQQVFRDSLGNRWRRKGDAAPHEWAWEPLGEQGQDEGSPNRDAGGRGGKRTGTVGADTDVRAQFAEVNWIVSLQGCSNDFWYLFNDGIAGVWLGCADGDEQQTFRS
jgi:hypothetical protein